MDNKNLIYKIRFAKSDEAKELTQLAFLSKAHWGYSPEWLESWRDDLTVTPELIKNSIAFVAELNGKIVGFWCRSVNDSTEPSQGLLFIHPDHMGKGVGKLLFKAVKEDAIKRGIYSFTIEADPNAVPFYEKMGAKKIGEKESAVIVGRKIPILRFDFKKE